MKITKKKLLNKGREVILYKNQEVFLQDVMGELIK
jgi:hypothetical protein